MQQAEHPAVDPERLYSAAEVAAHLGLTRTEVNRVIRRGYLVAVRVGGFNAIRGADLLAFERWPRGKPRPVQAD